VSRIESIGWTTAGGFIRLSKSLNGRFAHMTWETPEFVELNMDTEVGRYQDDLPRQDE